MMRIEEIKEAITQLPMPDLADFGAWYKEFEAQVWDKQIEEDIEAGRSDRVASRIKCTEMDSLTHERIVPKGIR